MAVGLRAVLYPNSVVKTYIQTNAAVGSSLQVATLTAQRHGLRSLWRGFLTCQMGIIPAHSVYVTGLEISKQKISRLARREGIQAGTAAQMGSFLGGAMASLGSQLVRTPTDVIAQRLMIQGTAGAAHTYHNGIHAFYSILKTDGIRGLYTGLGAAVLVSVPFSAIFWGTYSILKVRVGHSMSHLAGKFHDESTQHRCYVSPAVYGAATPFGVWEAAVFSSSAFISACAAAAITNPIDMVKTRIQTRAKTGRTAEGGRLAQKGAGIITHLWSIVKYEGWWSLSKGFSSRVMTIGPFSVLGILIYEGSKHISKKN